MESRHVEELQMEVIQLLHKQTKVLESRILGKVTDTEILEYEIRQELIDQLCEQLAHSSAALNTS
jgi:outer membrane lipopolysaccharide assembly protein LptE/RlpB